MYFHLQIRPLLRGILGAIVLKLLMLITVKLLKIYLHISKLANLLPLVSCRIIFSKVFIELSNYV